MAHAAKYAASACGHMLGHYDRSKKNLGDNIDPERTHLNYNLAPDHGCSQLDFIHQRLSEIRVHKRSDVNIMCDWCLTLPKEITYMKNDVHISSPNHDIVSKLFFERSYQFLENRYGKENVISAHVHRDETSDHMHFAFVPATEDKKHGGEKLAAKEVITKKDLKTFHADLEHYLDSFHDWHFGVINEATKEGNKAIEELKRGTAAEELQRQQQAAAQKIQELQMQIQREEAAGERRKEALRAEISDLERKRDGLLSASEVADLEGRRTLTGGLKGVSYTEFEALKRTAARVDEMAATVDEMTNKLERAEKAAQGVETKVLLAKASGGAEIRKEMEAKLEAKDKTHQDEIRKITNVKDGTIARLQKEITGLKSQNDKLEQVIDFLKSIIKDRLPAMLSKVENQIKQILNPSKGKERGE